MYALSLGFIIFILVAYQVQVMTFQYNEQQINGGTLHVQTKDHGKGVKGIQELDELVDDAIVGRTWITKKMNEFQIYFKIENLGRYFSETIHVRGVPPNFFRETKGSLEDKDSLFRSTYMPDWLYSRHGSSGAMISSYTAKNEIFIDANGTFSALSTKELGKDVGRAFETNENRGKSHVLRAGGIFDTAPVLFFTKYPTLLLNPDIGVSLPTFMRMSDGKFKSADEVPIDKYIFKTKKGASNSDLDRVKGKIQAIISRYKNHKLWDIRDELKPFEAATTALNYFFTFTTIVAMVVSFFSLLSSMFTNIYEQTKEIAILRAIGVKKSLMYRIYVYEAFIIVLSASLLGIGIGFVLAYVMTIQRALFTGLPIPFVFPWFIVGIVFAASMVFSALSALFPIYRVLQMSIVSIFRILS
eukprot:CAMPEP_0168516824 /NCGR_PEP_ID=MMETSP0405-20121227/5648_1 /TAXON_ID=498012 /ORGANISM="Trichosphaerium sp, Strain Am-I-7 wt" /LENGTH=413 /DNA_ID=CAMNT_0008536641 /DNA_START=801 /DNA_END=2042 /DNA_ORIENTATION=-